MALTGLLASNPPARATDSGGLYVPAEGLLLKVAERAWQDLGVAEQHRRLPGPAERDGHDAPIVPTNRYVRQFWNKMRSEKAIGTMASAITGVQEGLYRISVGSEPRAIIWHDHEGAVVWMCAGLSFPDGDKGHQKLYAEVDRLHDNDRLLPTPDEVTAARTERFWLTVVDVLAFALRQARQQPYTWCDAHVTGADGQTIRYGRFRVEEIQEVDGVLRDNFFVVVREPPPTIPHPPGWRSIMLAELFPERNDFEELHAADVPKGADLRPTDVILFLQEELLDDEDDDEDRAE